VVDDGGGGGARLYSAGEEAFGAIDCYGEP
jgi:hypothetical protein